MMMMKKGATDYEHESQGSQLGSTPSSRALILHALFSESLLHAHALLLFTMCYDLLAAIKTKVADAPGCPVIPPSFLIVKCRTDGSKSSQVLVGVKIKLSHREVVLAGKANTGESLGASLKFELKTGSKANTGESLDMAEG